MNNQSEKHNELGGNRGTICTLLRDIIGENNQHSQGRGQFITTLGLGKSIKKMKADICQGRTLNVVCHRDTGYIVAPSWSIINSWLHLYIVSMGNKIAGKFDLFGTGGGMTNAQCFA